MSPRAKKPEEVSAGAPAYIVTFSDMITLLLTFFVLLLSMANEQKDAMYKLGVSSFRRALADFGLSGTLFSGSTGPNFEHAMVKYPVDEGQDETNDRSIDAEAEVLRRVVLDLEKMMKISPAQIDGIPNTFTVADIRFDRGKWKLDQRSTDFLKRYCTQLEENFVKESITLYVVGFANKEKTAKEQWTISSRRAQAASEFIKTRLAGQSQCQVYCWGAGPGGDWTGSTGMVSEDTDILIVTLRKKGE